ncbi:MAG: SanA protein [Polaribacter sp.]
MWQALPQRCKERYVFSSKRESFSTKKTFKKTAMKKLFKLFKMGFVFLLLIALLIAVADFSIKHTAAESIYSSTEDIPYNKVGLLLGTGKFLKSGWLNLYYQYRIDAAVKLFESGKIDVILVSGDNSREGYDEPTTFKEDLIKRGIPPGKIHLDFAGFRTLDSVVRSKVVFGQESVTIISQPFHNERAIFIANAKGIKAVGFNAKDVSLRFGLKVQLRERLARVKVLLDLLFGKQPKFLGEKVKI